METQNQTKSKLAGTIFVGCMFIGMGIGMYLGKMTVGLFVGMGVGFIASAFAKAKI